MSKGNYRGNRSSGKKTPGGTSSKDKRSEEAASTDTGKGSRGYDALRTNDINWWNQSPMFADSTRVPFNRILGDPVNMPTVNISPGTLGGSTVAVPGILTVEFVPTIGSTNGGSNAPVNRCFNSLYGAIYSKTTGAMQFQQADLAMFMTSFSSIATLIGHMKRCLGISQLYSGQNYYYPRMLLQALNMDPDTVIGHQDELRMRLNDSILSFNALKIPDFMAVYKRQYALAHNVYADEDSTYAQLTAFWPIGYYLYVDTESKLDWITFTPADYNANGVLTAIETALEAWRNSSDLGLISGSIQRAFSENTLISLDYATSADVVLPTVDRNISWQVTNMTAARLNQSTLDITQDPVANTLVFTPQYMAGTPAPKAYHNRPIKWLNSFDGQVDDEFIMESTRLMQCPNPDVTSYSVFNANTELVESFRWHRIYFSNGKPTLESSAPLVSCFFLPQTGGSVLSANVNAAIQMLTVLSQFKYAPPVEVYTYDTAVNIYTWLGRFGDVYRYTTIDGDALAGLNKAALQSAFGVNQLG